MNIGTKQMEKLNELPLVELLCMTFSAVCYFICSLITIRLRMIGISYFMLILSGACFWRVVHILWGRDNQS